MRWLVKLLILALALPFMAVEPSKPDAAFDSTCKKALNGRRGAVLLVSLPNGQVLREYDRSLARKKFFGSSVYKPLTAFALLKEKAIKPDEKLATSRRVAVERYRVVLESRYEDEGVEVDLARAIAVSSNSYFYRMGARIEPETLLEYYRGFGLAGCVRAPATPEEKAEFPAHGGKCVRASAEDLVPYLRKLACDPSPEMALVRDAMRLAVTDGTGQGANVAGLDVCGKTGWLNGAGMFVAFAPKERPSLGIIVALPGATGSDAAGVAGHVLHDLPADLRPEAPAIQPRR